MGLIMRVVFAICGFWFAGMSYMIAAGLTTVGTEERSPVIAIVLFLMALFFFILIKFVSQEK